MTKEKAIRCVQNDQKSYRNFMQEMEMPPSKTELDYYETVLRVLRKAPEGWFECPCEDCRKECR